MIDRRTELRDEEEELTTADMAAGGRPQPPVQDRPAGMSPDDRAARRPAGDGAMAAPPRIPAPRAAVGTVGHEAVESKPSAPPPSAPLFQGQGAQELRSRWDGIQTGFVDNPRQAVEQADHLVAETIKQLAEMFANERNRLEEQWSRGGDVSTEDLRLALQRYRSFFDRLLSF